MVRIVALVLALAGCKGDRSHAAVEACLAEVSERAMSADCRAAVTAASHRPKLSAKARAVLQRWLQLDANLSVSATKQQGDRLPAGDHLAADPRALSARDLHLADVREFALPELARHPD